MCHIRHNAISLCKLETANSRFAAHNSMSEAKQSVLIAQHKLATHR